MSRRRLALAALVVPLGLCFCLACAPQVAPGVRIASLTSSPSPTQGHIASSAGVAVAAPAGLQDRLREVLSALPHDAVPAAPRIVADSSPADIRLTPTRELAPDVRVARRWSAATGANRIDLDGISLSDLSLQAQAGPLYVGSDYAPLVAALFTDAHGLRPIAPEELPVRLAREPLALAIVPADLATTAVHVLALDGVDPVRGDGDIMTYPLETRVRIVVVKRGEKADATAGALARGLEAADSLPTRLMFTGDIIPTRCVYDQSRRAGDWAAPFRAVASRLAAADLAVGSVDASISHIGQPIGCEETFNLLAPPQVIEGFKLANLRVITIATNHAKDCGRSQYCADRAFLDTLANLRSAGIQPAGGGLNSEEARRPAVVTVHDTRFAFLGYDDIADYYHASATAPGTAGLDPSTVAADVKAAAKAADVVIVMPHWGVEYTPDPSDRQRQVAQIAIEAGATMVVGNHPHVVQAAGPLAGGYVAYALGNFVFDQDWSVETTQGVALEAVFRGPYLAAVRYLPVQIENRLRPVFLGPEAGEPILKRIMTAEAKLAP